ncbi:MAG: hypothetical protein ABL984_13510 [Pyrinomonadaceae bacterium]
MNKVTTNSTRLASYRYAGLGYDAPISTFLKLALALWSVVALGIFLILVSPLGMLREDRLYLVPWCIGLGVVTLAPVGVLYAKGRLDPFHPLVLPVWTYFFPGFVVGGFILAAGFSQAHYVAYIRDEASDLPLTFLYIIVGFAALVAGFAFFPFGRIGEFLDRRILPKWEILDSDAKTGGLVLLGVGLASFSIAFSLGFLRYHRLEEVSPFSGLIAMSTVFWYQATLILSIHFFRLTKRRTSDYALMGVLVASAVLTALLLGSRGGLMHFLLPIAAGFLYSGRRIVAKHYAGLGLVLVALLVAGAIYGTTFRDIRGNQESASMEAYASTIPRTFESILEQGPVNVLGFGLSALATRIELVSSVAVVVSNYEILAPYEDEYGISNNIMVETFTFFIPRFIWNDKPVSVDPAKYAELYFNYSDNSFSMTPIADLLRNFGPVGIPIGMFLLGGLLRVLHQGLIGSQQFSYWRFPLYFLLVTSVSYDGTFGGIVPLLFKTAVVVAIGFVIVWLVTVRLGGRRSTA